MLGKSPLLLPLLAMMTLTALVWLGMYVRRLTYMLKNNIDPQAVSTPDKINAVLPEFIQLPSNNLKNLFEVPVIFYAVGILAIMQDFTPSWFVLLAWVYVGLRALHSLIQCTINIVKYRFIVYFISCWVLWSMLAGLICHSLC